MAHAILKNEVKHCKECGVPLDSPLFKYCTLCSKVSYRKSRNSYSRRVLQEGRKISTRQFHTPRWKRAPTKSEIDLAQKKDADQHALNKAIDQRLQPTFESKVYIPGTPEFEALAQMYLAKQ